MEDILPATVITGLGWLCSSRMLLRLGLALVRMTWWALTVLWSSVTRITSE